MNLVTRLRESGVFDGAWTAAASAGGKAQALVMLGAAGALGGIEATGLIVLVTSTAVLSYAVLDAGLTPQVGRLFANGQLIDRRQLLAPVALRVLLHIPVGALLYALVVLLSQRPDDAVPWALACIVYAIGFQISSSATAVAYGQFRFRQGATANAVIRLATVPVLLLLVYVESAVWGIVVTLAAGELVIGVTQYLLAGRADASRETRLLRLRNTWRYGIGALANTLMNRSDTVIVAAALTSTALGTYAVASQTQNAVTTIAMIPAGALIVHVARVGHGRQATGKSRVTLATVLGIYGVLAAPFAIAPEWAVQLLFRVSLEDSTPVRIVLVAGLFSVAGGVQMQQLTGLGEAKTIVRIWVTSAVIAVGSMLALAVPFGAVGAATGALVRDLAFFALSWAAVARIERRRVSA